jgi:phosphopantetheinyl transferase
LFLNILSKQYQQVLSFIQPEEKSRINRFHFIEDAKLSLIGRCLMRLLFSKLYKYDWDTIQFSRTEKNKPILVRNFMMMVMVTVNKMGMGWGISVKDRYYYPPNQ